MSVLFYSFVLSWSDFVINITPVISSTGKISFFSVIREQFLINIVALSVP